MDVIVTFAIAFLQTYEDILKLQEEIDACVYERDDLRVKTLPLQVQDNRLRALYDKENWKLREFNEWIARQDPDWQPPPRLPHARKKRNKVLREMAIAEARKKRALQAANKEQQSELDEYDAALSESVRSAETNEPGGEAKRTSRDGVLDSPSSFDTAFESPKAPESAPESSKPSGERLLLFLQAFAY